ncbi:helix-turn-helix domain-containing protein, partial [Escherichia coli]|nr:helix-turn-helix domain-containing protein [Escherichia coli]
DAAILEKHKEGLSVRKIGELFGVGKSTVDEVIKQVSGNTESVKSDTPEVSTSTVPMESTEDRSDTRATASFVNEQLEELLGPDYL